eukprot:11720687-Prorocentrum_lima.AAC.1
MGSPISLLTWVIAYDPIVEGLQDATGAHTPTFVDDLSAHVHGPAHAVLTEIALVRLSHAAGLQLDTH